MTPMAEYAVYKGDDLITIGTRKELAQKLNVKEVTVKFWATPENKRRNKGNRIVAYRLENNDDR